MHRTLRSAHHSIFAAHEDEGARFVVAAVDMLEDMEEQWDALYVVPAERLVA